ncbi:MAG: caspase family protein, partial [Bacteroidota bacterium]
MRERKSHLYALIVGISNYPDMEPLRGCQNDVENVKQALRRYAHRNNLLLNQAILLDSSAGRKEFICKFKSLFSGLKDGDSALFYFSGHGSRMTAPPAFEHSTANGMMETLVLYDSRLEDGWDLNDKELAYLIWKVTQRKKVHFTVILDSCYSSSATKGAAKNSEMDISFRKTSSNKKSRPWQAFAGAQEYIATARGVHVPMARHILMAACRKDEEAQEQRIEGKIQGVLTYALTSCLRQYSSRLTYAELIGRICAMAKDLTHDRQHPQLEGMNQADTQKYFLLPDQKNTPYLHMLHFCKERGWVLNSGMQHGLTAAQKDAKIQLLDDDFFAFAEGHIQSIYDHYSS